MARDIYLESRVLAADPVELIHILFEHGLMQIKLARTALAEKNIAGRAKAVSKALAVVGELESSLDHKAGGSLSQNLGKLYQYMRKRLCDGNLKSSDAALAEVESLLQTLDDGWNAMQRATSVPAALPYAQAMVENLAHSWSA